LARASPDAGTPQSAAEKSAIAIQRGNFAAYEGDFARALVFFDEAAAAVADDPMERPHANVVIARLPVLAEIGDTAGLRRASEEFLAKRDAWEPAARMEDWALARDPTGRMLAILRRAGAVTPDQERARRDSRAVLWRKGLTPPMLKPFIWIHLYASAVETS